MPDLSIVDKIIETPHKYHEIIENASYDELKVVFIVYKQKYTEENPSDLLKFYSEDTLREKILGCSKSILCSLNHLK